MPFLVADGKHLSYEQKRKIERHTIANYNTLKGRQEAKRELNLSDYTLRLESAKRSNKATKVMAYVYALGCVYATAETAFAAMWALKGAVIVFTWATGNVITPGWNATDTGGVGLDILKEYSHGNHLDASLNFLSSAQLGTGTTITTLEVCGVATGVGLGAGGLGLAPVSFAMCMFFSAMVSARKLYKLDKDLAFLKPLEQNIVLKDLGSAADLNRLEEITETIKEIRINREVALDNEQKEDEAISGLTVSNAIAILEAEKHVQKVAVSSWLMCTVAMTLIALVTLAVIAGTGGTVLIALAAGAIVAMGLSVWSRCALMGAEDLAQEKIGRLGVTNQKSVFAHPTSKINLENTYATNHPILHKCHESWCSAGSAIKSVLSSENHNQLAFK